MEITESALTPVNLLQGSVLGAVRFVGALDSSESECSDDSVVMAGQMIENTDFRCWVFGELQGSPGMLGARVRDGCTADARFHVIIQPLALAIVKNTRINTPPHTEKLG